MPAECVPSASAKSAISIDSDIFVDEPARLRTRQMAGPSGGSPLYKRICNPSGIQGGTWYPSAAVGVMPEWSLACDLRPAASHHGQTIAEISSNAQHWWRESECRRFFLEKM